MLKGKALIKEIDMLEKMQTQAIDYAFQALDFYDVSDCISIAAHIKMNLTRNMEVDGNVWWVQTLGVSSLIQKGLFCIFIWGLSISLYSRVHLLRVGTEEKAEGFADL
ncbi:hypothetical protein GQ457_06G028480 [Hibiscus cannabinus]